MSALAAALAAAAALRRTFSVRTCESGASQSSERIASRPDDSSNLDDSVTTAKIGSSPGCLSERSSDDSASSCSSSTGVVRGRTVCSMNARRTLTPLATVTLGPAREGAMPPASGRADPKPPPSNRGGAAAAAPPPPPLTPAETVRVRLAMRVSPVARCANGTCGTLLAASRCATMLSRCECACTSCSILAEIRSKACEQTVMSSHRSSGIGRSS